MASFQGSRLEGLHCIHMLSDIYDAVQVNVCMNELPEFDETPKVQKKYNLLSWYLVAVIVFYAIPAYQLVITYQQVLASCKKFEGQFSLMCETSQSFSLGAWACCQIFRKLFSN